MSHLWIVMIFFHNKHIRAKNLTCLRWQLATNIALYNIQQTPTYYKMIVPNYPSPKVLKKPIDNYIIIAPSLNLIIRQESKPCYVCLFMLCGNSYQPNWSRKQALLNFTHFQPFNRRILQHFVL
jgi:hypothetical protein